MRFNDNTRIRNHYIGELNYHIIFSTKFRRKCLSNIENKLYDSFKYCESKSHFKIKKMKQDKDHINLLVNIKQVICIVEKTRLVIDILIQTC